MRIVDAVPHIVGYKMITEDFNAMARALRAYTKRRVAILPAGAANMHPAITNGWFDGTVSGSWNYAMEKTVDAVVAARDDRDPAKAEALWADGLLALHRTVASSEKGYRLHSAYKLCTWMRGLIPDPFLRAPQRRLPLAEVIELRAALEAAHYEVISAAALRKAYPQLS
jgi:dihydrodipicolinate synthase/N-acetylneuraminate lyase